MRLRIPWSALLAFGVGACELKENAPPLDSASAGLAPALPPRVDTVTITDTVMRTQVETVYVVDTVYIEADSRASAKTRSRTPASGAQSATPTGATKAATKPVAVTKAPVDTRVLPATSAKRAEPVKATTAVTAAVSKADLDYLRSRKLLIPVLGFPMSRIPDNFLEKRGTRQHSALDFMAKRGTPVVSTDDGTIAKVHTSVGGGLTLYVADPRGEFIYYYAHLDSYAKGVKEGVRVKAGDVLGYVGSTGNATANAPHLHFAIGKMDREKRWWKTTAIDPKPLLARPAPDPR